MNSKTPPRIIGIVGAGTMGSGIALAALYAGCEVFVQDAYPEMLEKASAYIRKFLGKKDLGERIAKLHLVSKLEELALAQVVIEAAPERMELKREIFGQLDRICPPETILASNTSTLPVTAIAAATRHPERVAGMHFFNPAPVLKLVEVVRAAQTSEATVATLVDLAKALGKTPVVTGDTPGFIVNRLARPFYGEALRLLGENVAPAQTIDHIVERGGGFKMGPFKLMDLIGIDVNAEVMRSMYEQTFGEPRYRPHWLQLQKVAEGALGRKTGRGFYEYENGEFKDATVNFQPEHPVGGGQGQLVVSAGGWAPGLADLCRQAGYAVVSEPQAGQPPVAAFVAAGREEGAEGIVRHLDQALAHEVPLIVQCADISFSEAAAWVTHPERLIGFDGLFLAEGSMATLVDGGQLEPGVRQGAEALMASLGKQATWVADASGLVLPRIVGQLINEAAFAAHEAVADLATFDTAMKLGVSYPRGPLEWGEAIGYRKVLAVLDHLYAEYHEERYRACLLLRHWAREEAQTQG